MMDTYIAQPQMIMSKNDTAEVCRLVEAFLDNLQNNRYEDAVAMLHYLNKDSIEDLSPKRAKAQINVLRAVHGVKYTIDEMRFLKETDSQVKYSVTLFEKETNDPRPNTVSFFIKPVRRAGKWYLTMADTETDTNGTEIKN